MKQEFENIRSTVKPDCRVRPFSPRSRGRKAEKSWGRGGKMSQGRTQERPLGGQPPKGQSALLKQEESGKYTSTRMLPISMGG